MVAFSLFTDFASFADITHLVSDHLLQSRSRNVFDGFLQLINGRRLSSAHVNHGIVTEEIIKGIEAVWEPFNLTGGPTDGPTDGRTDVPSYRDARTH